MGYNSDISISDKWFFIKIYSSLLFILRFELAHLLCTHIKLSLRKIKLQIFTNFWLALFLLVLEFIFDDKSAHKVVGPCRKICSPGVSLLSFSCKSNKPTHPRDHIKDFVHTFSFFIFIWLYLFFHKGN